MSIVLNEKRVGRFTSSKCHVLIGKGRGHEFTVAAQTYIEEKRHERNLGRSLDMGSYSRAATWGLFLETYVYEHFMGLDYTIQASETTVNPNIDYHAGSTDLLIKGKLVSDMKGYGPRKFCAMVDCFNKNDLTLFKKKFKQEYFQLVSNALIHDVDTAESIVYMPTESELEEIKEMAYEYDGVDQWKYRFIYESPNHELAYIPNGSKYKSLNKYRFEVPDEDKQLLIDRLALAEHELTKG